MGSLLPTAMPRICLRKMLIIDLSKHIWSRFLLMYISTVMVSAHEASSLKSANDMCMDCVKVSKERRLPI